MDSRAIDISADAISGGRAPNEEVSESDSIESGYTNEAWDLFTDGVGIGRRNWLVLGTLKEDGEVWDGERGGGKIACCISCVEVVSIERVIVSEAEGVVENVFPS